MDDKKNLHLRKMLFIFNAIEDGWCVKKRNGLYIFTKNHENKKEIFKEEYLTNFIINNISIDKLNN